MKLEMYVVRDGAVGVYMRPVFVRNRGEMLRSITDEVNDAKTELSRHAMDYSVFFVGSYDDADGMFDILPPQFVVNCIDLVVKDVSAPFGSKPPSA